MKNRLTLANSCDRVAVGAKKSLLKAETTPDRFCGFFVPAICNIAGVRRIQYPQGEEVCLTFGRFLAPATKQSLKSPLGSVFQHEPKGLFYDFATFTIFPKTHTRSRNLSGKQSTTKRAIQSLYRCLYANRRGTSEARRGFRDDSLLHFAKAINFPINQLTIFSTCKQRSICHV